MSTLRRSLTVSTPLERVADYLSDLTTSTQWDPHTVACVGLDDGPPAVGARYEHTREFHGYRVTVEMTVIEYEPQRRIAWRGGNDLAQGRETFEFGVAGGETEITHSVAVELSGIAKFGERMVPSVMKRIADDGTDTLRHHLEQLS
jgi:hypothetical protein